MKFMRTKKESVPVFWASLYVGLHIAGTREIRIRRSAEPPPPSPSKNEVKVRNCLWRVIFELEPLLKNVFRVPDIVFVVCIPTKDQSFTSGYSLIL